MSRQESVKIGSLATSYFVNDGRESDDDPTLLFIHGLGGNYLQWPPRLRRMARVRAVAVDLPGHRQSGGKAADSVAGYMRWLDGFVQSLQAERLVLVGYSLGGAIALNFARSQHVAGLALVACGASFAFVEPEHVDQPTGDALVDWIVEAASGGTTTEIIRERLRQSLVECSVYTLRSDLSAARQFDANSAQEICAPVELISGSEDGIATPAAVDALHHLLPTSEWTMIEGASHMLLWEKESEVSAAIRSLIERVKSNE